MRCRTVAEGYEMAIYIYHHHHLFGNPAGGQASSLKTLVGDMVWTVGRRNHFFHEILVGPKTGTGDRDGRTCAQSTDQE